MPQRIILSLALIAAAPILAQTAEPTTHSVADLQQREAKLLGQGGPNLVEATNRVPHISILRCGHSRESANRF